MPDRQGCRASNVMRVQAALSAASVVKKSRRLAPPEQV